MSACRPRARMSTLAVLLLLAAALPPLASASNVCPGGSTGNASYIYIWAGASDTRVASDTLFTLRLCDSHLSGPNDFAKIVGTTPLPRSGVEPHHLSISTDGNTLGGGGLLAALGGLPQVYFFDCAGRYAAAPRLKANIAQPHNSAITDEFLPTPDGGFLVTMMGSASGASPGRVLRYSKTLRLLAEGPSDDSYLRNTGCNPHGIGAAWSHNTFVTADYIDPASTLVGSPGVIARTTVRVWNLTTMRQTYVLDSGPPATEGPPGHMDVVAIADTGLFYSTRLNGWLYLVNTTATPPTLRKVYYLGTPPGAGGMLLKSFRKGTRLAMSSFAQSTVTLFDTSRPAAPVVLSSVSLGVGAGAHVLTLSRNERLMAVSTYFLDEGSAGVVRLPGDQSVHFFTIDAFGTSLTPHFLVPKVDFKNLRLHNGTVLSFRPHGMAFSLR